MQARSRGQGPWRAQEEGGDWQGTPEPGGGEGITQSAYREPSSRRVRDRGGGKVGVEPGDWGSRFPCRFRGQGLVAVQGWGGAREAQRWWGPLHPPSPAVTRRPPLPPAAPRRPARSWYRQKITLRDYRNEATAPVDDRKQRNGFPPNYIHSLDSAHMMMTAMAVREAGGVFAAVHDSFWTHAATVDLMGCCIRWVTGEQ